MLTFSKRLEFEGKALAQIYAPAISRPRRRAKGRFMSGALAIAVVVSGAILGGGMLVQNGLFFGADRRAITRTTDLLLTGLATNDSSLMLSACAEGYEGARQLASVEAKAFGGVVAPSIDETAREERVAALETLRSELANAGVDWTDVHPVAFGGIRGRVDAADMEGPVTSLAGSVYFASRGGLYALEFSAWRCDGDYVITEVWQGSEVAVGLEDLETLSSAQFDAFERESPEPDSPVEIEYPKHLFFYF